MAAKKKSRHWIGFDFGGTKLLAVLFDDSFNPIARKRKKTKAAEGRVAVLDRMVQMIRDCLEEADVQEKALAGIGMSSPGPLDLDRGIILDTPNMGFKNVKLKKTMEDVFRCPAVVANDVDLGVYGEYRFGAAKGARCTVGLFPGTGLGGGCVYEGRILRGRTHSCMEIGHVQVLPNGPLCGCGKHGCLEALTSRLAIAAAAATAAHRGDAPFLRDSVGADLGAMRSRAIARAIESGDDVVREIVLQAANWLGVGVGITVNLLAPDVVVLGGGLVEAMPDLILKEVERSARSHVMSSFEKSFEVKVSELGDDATAMGAGALAKDSYEE
ncbi:MAG: ROK family protein [Lentisphaerae bacterium]|nr:ROK family protein [Lentisphaerota bacterium]